MIEAKGDGLFRVSGELVFGTVSRVLAESRSKFHGAPQLCVDLSGVDRADSAGLALLGEWLRVAKSARASITFRNVPAKMLATARVSDLADLLPIERDGGDAR